MSDITWPELIGLMYLVRQQIDEVDTTGLLPLTIARAHASDTVIAEVEAQQGLLPADYREFLRHSDGWPGFYFRADLFGTAELLGREIYAEAVPQMLAAHEGDLQARGLLARDVLPVMSDTEHTLAVVVRDGHALAGRVLWFGEEQAEEYDSFTFWFGSVLQEFQQVLDSLQAGAV